MYSPNILISLLSSLMTGTEVLMSSADPITAQTKELYPPFNRRILCGDFKTTVLLSCAKKAWSFSPTTGLFTFPLRSAS